MILRNFDDPLSLEAVRAFFDNLFWRQRERLDQEDVLGSLDRGVRDLQFQFAEAAYKFKCFDSPGEAVLDCPDDDLREEIIEGLLYNPHPGRFARRAQPYTVQLFPDQVEKLVAAGDVERIGEGLLPVLIRPELYDDDLGLLIELSGRRSPAGMIV
jgi:hypothetical protein